MSEPSLYERDICLWAEKTAELLRSHCWEELDLENLIDEVEDLSRRERDKLLSTLRVLLTHLLKWQYQPHLRGKSWEVTIKRWRREITEQIEDTPSLRRFLDDTEWLEKTYRRACNEASDQTGLPLDTFPQQLPSTIEQILDGEF
jgi:hypothetical protein